MSEAKRARQANHVGPFTADERQRDEGAAQEVKAAQPAAAPPRVDGEE